MGRNDPERGRDNDRCNTFHWRAHRNDMRHGNIFHYWLALRISISDVEYGYRASNLNRRKRFYERSTVNQALFTHERVLCSHRHMVGLTEIDMSNNQQNPNRQDDNKQQQQNQDDQNGRRQDPNNPDNKQDVNRQQGDPNVDRPRDGNQSR